ncbi:hypothetical protein GALMADRAFT_243066 [Galerina marginata CBS 339.88]|uniref:Uncharacterized protein n=1 Tax=Galerina marginata (strain CBS 339.88) TaxID=685588 RepID=A0A067TJL9_GALM3|nr:hypothetical protein GALMADRAFT_243066 [Galerina marginata CBS 339.88]
MFIMLKKSPHRSIFERSTSSCGPGTPSISLGSSKLTALHISLLGPISLTIVFVSSAPGRSSTSSSDSLSSELESLASSPNSSSVISSSASSSVSSSLPSSESSKSEIRTVYGKKCKNW